MLTLHGTAGILNEFDLEEAQLVLGPEEGPNVPPVAGEGIAPRHAWLRITAGRMQVEDLACGTLVNGHPIEGRVEAEYPASVQFGGGHADGGGEGACDWQFSGCDGPWEHWRTVAALSSLRLDGSTACMTIDGVIETEPFSACEIEGFLPALKSVEIVIVDNLSPHENEETLPLIEAVGVIVWCPPAYSPDLSPIAKMWNKVKQAL